jgi:hypothetical protein
MDLVHRADFCLNQNEKGQGFFSDLEWGAKTGWEDQLQRGPLTDLIHSRSSSLDTSPNS